MKKIWGLFFIVFLILPFNLKAQNISGLYLDSAMAKNGYAVSSEDNKFKLTITPAMFGQESFVEIKTYDYTEMAYSFLPNKNLVSQIYSYDIKTADRGKISVPVAINYESNNDNDVRLYNYDGNKKSWYQVTAQQDKIKNTFSTVLPFYYIQLAVFEDQYQLANLNAKAAIVIAEDTNEIIIAKNPDEILPLASLTKLTTALVLTDKKIPWNKYLTISNADKSYGSIIPLKVGEKVRLGDLYNAMLIASANNAAKAMVRGAGFSQAGFIRNMNIKAAALGLKNTQFTDVAGLLASCVSTPREYAQIVKMAFTKQEIVSATTKSNYSFYTLAQANRYNISNTNKLLGSDLKILGGKTGSADFSGYNLALKIEKNGKKYIMVIMGADSREASFSTAKILADNIK